MPGRIVLLNGAPRAGKSSIAKALQAKGDWMVLGVDALMAMTPPHLLPGIGLRPGGEHPELEGFVRRSYAALFDSLAAFSRHGLNVASDIGMHDGYSRPLGLAELRQEKLAGLPVLFVGVRCPIETIMARRNADAMGRYLAGDAVPPQVQRWQDVVHANRRYDLELDTARLAPGECAERILTFLEAGAAFASAAPPEPSV